MLTSMYAIYFTTSHQYTTNTCLSFFFFNDTATTEIYTLSLHDALPILWRRRTYRRDSSRRRRRRRAGSRSEEHTSELQSLAYLVCRLLLEKKKYQLSHSIARRSCTRKIYNASRKSLVCIVSCGSSTRRN